MNPDQRDEQNRLAEENLNLKSAVGELSILNDIAAAVSSTQSLNKVISLIVQKCVKYLHAEEGAIHLTDQSHSANAFYTIIRVKEDSSNNTIRFNKQISDAILANRKPLLINDFKYAEEYELDEKTLIAIKSLLSVPMILKGKMIGVLSLFNKRIEGGFTDNDKRLLSIIAAQSASVIENARLLEEEKKLLVIQQELKVAGEIQKNILPREIPIIEGYDIYALNIPALEVGGDYFDFITVSDSITALALGDVSGKGLPASMLMANLQATLRGQLLFSSSAKECISRANRLLYRSTDKRKFVTLFFAFLNHQKHILTYCNAGHNIPFFLYDTKIINLDKGGIILGWREYYDYSEEEVPFGKGSLLVIYSDGVTEALNNNQGMYGDERLFNLLRENRFLSSKELTGKILDDVSRFTAGTPQSDDITLLIIKRN